MISPKAAIDFILIPGLGEALLSQIRDKSKDLTIPPFWFKLEAMSNANSMAGRRIILSAALIFLAAWPLLSAIKQVRVIAERASIYIEPSRTSSRIEIVGKGTILNLLQERKVKDLWYYISFNSPRYGTRISGFIQESAVELVAEAPPVSPKAEETVPPKIEPEPPRPAEAAPPPKVEEKKEVPAETPAAPRIVESIALTKIPKGMTFKFPKKEPERQDEAWRVVEIVPPEKPAPEVKPAPKTRPATIESVVLSRLPKSKSYKFPRKEVTLQEAVWRIGETAPVIAERPKVKEKVETQPAAPEVKEKPAEPKPKSKPTEPPPIKTPQVRPARKGPGLITLGLGYGSSFGGAGGCLQLNTRAGFSLHAGVGLYPTSLIYSETDWVKNKPLWSVGLKYYLPFRSPSFAPFVDIQYGGLRVEAAQVVIGIWDYDYVLSQEQKSLSGPSCLAGIEYRMGRLGFSAALGASYAITSWEYLETKLSLVFDTGLVFHF
jgi:hypothetical protein